MVPSLRSLDEPAALAGVDGVTVLAVLAVGVLRHHGPAGLTDPATVAPLALSFLAGWYGLALLTGLYERAPDGGGRHSLRPIAATALGGANVGVLVRAHAFGDVPASPFPLVITAILTVTTLGARSLVRAALATAGVGADSLGAGEHEAQE